MNAAYLVGASFSLCRRWALSRRAFPLLRTFLGGSEWGYDVSRFAGSRDLRVLFDVGANVGQTALYLRPFFPRADIYAFEPTPGIFERLKTNTLRHKRIRPHATALGERIGVANFCSGDYSEQNCVVQPGGDGANCTVPMTTLDAFCEQQTITTIDVLKIDVEGYELNVLQGASRLLQLRSIRCVYAEVTFDASDGRHTSFCALADLLQPFGFRMAGLYESWFDPAKPHHLHFANALFWNDEFSPTGRCAGAPNVQERS